MAEPQQLSDIISEHFSNADRRLDTSAGTTFALAVALGVLIARQSPELLGEVKNMVKDGEKSLIGETTTRRDASRSEGVDWVLNTFEIVKRHEDRKLANRT